MVKHYAFCIALTLLEASPHGTRRPASRRTRRVWRPSSWGAAQQPAALPPRDPTAGASIASEASRCGVPEQRARRNRLAMVPVLHALPDYPPDRMFQHSVCTSVHCAHAGGALPPCRLSASSCRPCRPSASTAGRGPLPARDGAAAAAASRPHAAAGCGGHRTAAVGRRTVGLPHSTWPQHSLGGMLRPMPLSCPAPHTPFTCITTVHAPSLCDRFPSIPSIKH